MDQLDAERIEALRRWGESLARDGREEMRAAGRAILLLIEENERLRQEAAAPAEEPVPDDEAAADDVESGLRSRLRRVGRRQAETTST